MPYSYEIDPKQRLARIVLSGYVSGAELHKANQALAADPAEED